MPIGNQSRYDLTRDELSTLLANEPRYRVEQLWDGLYRQCLEPSAMTNLSKRLRQRLDQALPTALTLVNETRSGDGDTTKWLWQLPDGALIETVLMHYAQRSTVCVSSQAGCAMACGFCATGQGGFRRNLTTGEIVEQVIAAMRNAGQRRVSNVVFMGMGEPLANYERMWAAVQRLHGDVGISARHITISTVGIVPGIIRLANEALPVNLAVSLHAANDALRDKLVPPNRRWPLADLMQACERYLQEKRRRVSFEWALIDRVNDEARHAQELAALAKPLRAHVNLIPLNPTPGYAVSGSPRVRVEQFRDQLQTLGVNATIRDNRGTAIDAACGQLRANQVSITDKSNKR